MAEHSVINDRFITQYSNLYNKVYGITGGGSNRNQETRTPDKEILVKILTVVEKPQGKSYVKGQLIQFTAREVHYNTLGGTKDARRLFNEDGYVETDTSETFAVSSNVYGIDFEFDFLKPLDAEADLKGKVFSCKSRGIADAAKPNDDYTRQWVIVPKGTGGDSVFDCSVGAVDEAKGVTEYAASIFVDYHGGDNLLEEGTLVIVGALGTEIPLGTVISVRKFTRDISPAPVQPPPPAEQLPTTETIFRPVNNWLSF